MTTTPEGRAELKALAEKATPGPWHHCQPYMVVPAQRTIHGPVPAERADYVSTWPDRGTPPGHRVVIPMPREAGPGVRSDDMAFIAAANPATVLSLLAALEEAEGRMTEALTMTGSKDLADLIDMANIGRSMMERMAQVTESGPMRGWSPADDPAEIVTDLANRLDDALHDYGNAESEAKGLEVDVADLTARAEASERREAWLREALRLAEPLVETLHSTSAHPEVRGSIWGKLKTIRAALTKSETPSDV